MAGVSPLPGPPLEPASGKHPGPSRHRTVLLVGNPNTGKSTLFNALSGLRQRVGNYPGVTVEKKVGTIAVDATTIDLVDLPGTYSLAARSPDEWLTTRLLLGQQPGEPAPDVILNIVDASNLERNLYLTTQLLDLGLPVVIALNMTDVAQKKGFIIDPVVLAERLGVRVVPVQANAQVGIETLRHALAGPLHSPRSSVPFPEPFEREVAEIGGRLTLTTGDGAAEPRRQFLARRLLIDVQGAVESECLRAGPSALGPALAAARQRLAAAQLAVPKIEARIRYAWLREKLRDCQRRESARGPDWTARIDAVLTHRVWGLAIFLGVMFLVFQSIFLWAKPLMDAIDAGKGLLAEAVSGAMAPGPLRSLLVQGVIEGVGGIVIFLPQIMILFAFIAVLEDCGYMARAAFLMDKLMARCGLSGKAFIPLLSSFACAIPGVMATRVIEDRRDRLATIVIAPLMSCSARLPVYLLLAGAFLSSYGDWVPGLAIFAMYVLGLVTAPLVALALKRTLLRGETPVFVMEMPAYQWPAARQVLYRMFERGWAFVRRAGTIILASMVLVWALLYFPASDPSGQSYDLKLAALEKQVETLREELAEARQEPGAPAAEAAQNLARLEAELESREEEVRHLLETWKTSSWLGRMGKGVEPVVEPLGWDWRIGMAVLASFPAREVVVGTLGIIYNEGEVDAEEAEARASLGRRLREATWDRGSAKAGQPVFNVAVALSLMAFFSLCCQCASTLAVIKRETNSWLWPGFTFVYMTGLAYVAALVVFQVGSRL
ncbi:MAG TPA: ferrous iron transport protein B [Gemmatales bacterium]|nr:ferrous iron transport protein B [Gemmatales bacterium]